MRALRTSRMTTQIRSAAAGDAAEIARLTTLLGYPASTGEIADRLRTLLQSTDHFIAVADAAQGLAGWIAAERRVLLESGIRAEIVGLVVDPDARRAGIGAALVQAAEAWAIRQNLAVMSVRSNIARIESHPFYERLGYVRQKTQHAYTKHLGT